MTALLADPNMGGTEDYALEGSMLNRAIAYVGPKSASVFHVDFYPIPLMLRVFKLLEKTTYVNSGPGLQEKMGQAGRSSCCESMSKDPFCRGFV